MILIDGRNEGLWFEPPMKGTRLRKKPPTSVVLHHTAGEGGASQVFRTLKNRGLSIHFVVDNDDRPARNYTVTFESADRFTEVGSNAQYDRDVTP